LWNKSEVVEIQKTNKEILKILVGYALFYLFGH